MKRTWLTLMIVLMGLGLLGAFWAAHAQELFLPPPVLQPEAAPAKPPEKKGPAPAKYPYKTQPLEKPKADPTLIIPAEAFELPRVQREVFSGEDSKPGLLPTNGVGIPAPAFPPPVVPGPALPLPIPPVAEPKPIVVPVIPVPPPEPTKMLIEPLSKNPPASPNPPPLPAPPQPPSVVFPQPVSPGSGTPTEKPKSFVRLRSAANDIAPAPIGISPPGGLNNALPPPPAVYVPHPGALVNLQTPAVSIEKLGAATLRAGATQSYQIVIRNLGSVSAQQVRVEEEIPAGAKLVSADPQPQGQGTRAIWTLPALAPGGAQTVRFALKADATLLLGNTTSAFVAAAQATSTTTLRPPPPINALIVRLSGPERASVGKTVSFDIEVANQAGLPLTGIVLFGYLPEGLNTPDGREIEGAVDGAIAPGSAKILKMPAKAVKPGRYTVRVKVVTSGGEASATATLDITAEALQIQQPPMTRLPLGREGDLHIEVTNGTGKPVRNVAVASLLPEGIDFLAASDRGLFQANHRTVYWLIDAMPAGQTRTLAVRVVGAKAGLYQNPVSAKADGVAEVRSTAAITLEGMSNLKLRVVDRDNPLELGKDTTYEIQVSNSGGASAHNIRVQVLFPAGMLPRNAQGNTRHAVDKQTVIFEPIAALAPEAQAIYRVSAQAQAPGDQRVRFAVVSDEMQTPLQREISTKVY